MSTVCIGTFVSAIVALLILPTLRWRTMSARARAVQWMLTGFLVVASLAKPSQMHALQNEVSTSSKEHIVQLRVSSECKRCRVELRPVAIITDTRFEVDLNFPRVSRLRDGRFAVGGQGGFLGIFDSHGVFLKQFGQTGSGPGEFRRPVSVFAAANDSFYIDDLTLRRITLVDSAMRHAVRSFNVPAHIDALRLEDGRLVLSGYVATTQRAGQPLHVVDPNGQVVRSFGVATSVVQKNPDRMLTRYLSAHPSGGFIAAMTHQYQFEHWSNALTMVKRYVREVSWFPPIASGTAIDFMARNPMPAQLFGVSTTAGSSLAFATILLAASNWKADPIIKGTTGELSSMPPRPFGIYMNKYVDTIIEAIDLNDGTIMATSRFSGTYSPISHSPFYWTLQELPDGNVQIRIVKAELIRAGAPNEF